MPVLSDFIFFCCLPAVVTEAWDTQDSGFPCATGGIYDELSDDAERTRYRYRIGQSELPPAWYLDIQNAL